MSSVIEGFQKRSFLPTKPLNDALPISNNTDSEEQGIRRRFSSLSLRIQPISQPATQWAIQRSKSVSSMGEYAGSSVKKWWEWGWAWILSKKPIFAQDLEMNEQEIKALGSHNRGSWRHVFFKVRTEVKKMVSSDPVGLPQTNKFKNHHSSHDDGVLKS